MIVESGWNGDQLHLFFANAGVDFGYDGQKPLFKNVEFGIDMESRSKYML